MTHGREYALFISLIVILMDLDQFCSHHLREKDRATPGPLILETIRTLIERATTALDALAKPLPSISVRLRQALESPTPESLVEAAHHLVASKSLIEERAAEASDERAKIWLELPNCSTVSPDVDGDEADLAERRPPIARVQHRTARGLLSGRGRIALETRLRAAWPENHADPEQAIRVTGIEELNFERRSLHLQEMIEKAEPGDAAAYDVTHVIPPHPRPDPCAEMVAPRKK